MSDADQHRAEAAQLPDGDLVALLLTQHAEIIDALDRVTSATGDELMVAFEALSTYLKAHEAAEQTVVRPVTEETAAPGAAEARITEERTAEKALAALADMGVDDADFKAVFASFKKDVLEHAEKEEHEEFPTLRASRSDEERLRLGADFLDVFSKAG